VVGELAAVETVRIDAAVGAVGNAYAGLDALREPFTLASVVSLFLRKTSAPQPIAPPTSAM
jgi:hypothetical protein